MNHTTAQHSEYIKVGPLQVWKGWYAERPAEFWEMTGKVADALDDTPVRLADLEACWADELFADIMKRAESALNKRPRHLRPKTDMKVDVYYEGLAKPVVTLDPNASAEFLASLAATGPFFTELLNTSEGETRA